jgi:ABC-type bacteriocin/lantibiotic exporter with double-glycine peptidase domain
LKVFDKAPQSFEHLETTIGQPTALGYSLQAIRESAEEFGLHTEAASTTLDNLVARRERFCCIAHINGNHFVLLGEHKDGQVLIVDPPRSYRLPTATFLSQWNGTALLLSDQELEPEESVARRMWWMAAAWRCAWCVLGLVCVAGSIRTFKWWRARA